MKEFKQSLTVGFQHLRDAFFGNRIVFFVHVKVTRASNAEISVSVAADCKTIKHENNIVHCIINFF